MNNFHPNTGGFVLSFAVKNYKNSDQSGLPVFNTVNMFPGSLTDFQFLPTVII